MPDPASTPDPSGAAQGEARTATRPGVPRFLQPSIFDEKRPPERGRHAELERQLKAELGALLEQDELRRLLEHPALVEVDRRYTEKDRVARDEKQRFVRFSGHASLSILIGTIAAALLVSSASLNDPAGGGGTGLLLGFVRWVLVVATVGSGSYALFCLTFLNRAGLLRHFREARSRAELERQSYFTKLAALAPSGSPAAPAALEVFRICQLEGQRLFFLDRIDSARRGYQRTVWLGSIAVVVVAFSGGGFGIAGVFEPRLLPLAGLGAIGAALATYASQREALNQDERTGERYGKTLDALSLLMERYAEVRRDVEAGAARVFSEFVGAVQEQLALEHREWIEDSEALEQAVAALDASLAKLRKQRAEALRGGAETPPDEDGAQDGERE